jgi:hypothetical protein
MAAGGVERGALRRVLFFKRLNRGSKTKFIPDTKDDLIGVLFVGRDGPLGRDSRSGR